MSLKKLSQEARQKRVRMLRKLQAVRLFNSYLDEAKVITGSDRRTAATLGLSAQKVSDIRKGRRNLSPFAAVRLARLLKKNTFGELANALSRSAKSSKTRIFWLDFSSGIWPARPDTYEQWAKDPRAKKYPSRG